MKKENNWYIITGAPSSGKSTLLNFLKEKGYKTVQEAARSYIDEQIVQGLTINEIRRDEEKFQEKILERKMDWESKASPEELIFWERGVPDTEAYCKLHGFKITEKLKKALANCVYKKVFLLDLVTFKEDYARTETPEEQRKLQQFLKKSYTDLGFEVVRVPIFETKKERLNFVLNNL
mgnify:CR=1 FL=1